jgi:hypothetical protein
VTRKRRTSAGNSTAAGPRPTARDANARDTRRIFRRKSESIPARQPTNDRGLIRKLVQDAVAGADLLRRDLAEEREDQRVTRISGRQSRRRVQKTWARHAAVDSGLACRLRKAKRHV